MSYDRNANVGQKHVLQKRLNWEELLSVTFEAPLWTGFHTDVPSDTVAISYHRVFVPEETNFPYRMLRTSLNAFPTCCTFAG